MKSLPITDSYGMLKYTEQLYIIPSRGEVGVYSDFDYYDDFGDLSNQVDDGYAIECQYDKETDSYIY